MKIKIPKSKHKRALFLIDLQHGLMKHWDKSVIKNIQTLLDQENYDVYVEATFLCKKGSLRYNQRKWSFRWEPMIPEIKMMLENKKVIHIKKETSSIFKGNKKLLPILRKNNIKEIHLIGFDTNDCVLASAQESLDYNFYTYVIEECVGSSGGKKIHESAMHLLRYFQMTNHSV